MGIKPATSRLIRCAYHYIMRAVVYKLCVKFKNYLHSTQANRP